MADTDYFKALLRSNRHKLLLIDSNLLLLFLIGICDPQVILKAKRLQCFDLDDFATLEKVVALFRGILTTPHIMTETSNHLHQSCKDIAFRRAVWTTFLALFETHSTQVPQSWSEQWVEAINLAKYPHIEVFGLTDCGMESLCGDNVVLLSTDSQLVDRVQRQGNVAINFAHLIYR